MGETEGLSAALKGRIFAAVAAEVATRGVDNFSIDGVANRCGVDPGVICAWWRDSRVLMMDGLLTVSDQQCPTADTGSLDGDLQEIADSLTQTTASEVGRQLIHRLLPGGRDADLSAIGRDFWAVRFDSIETIMRRAAERGEVRAGVSPADAVRMFTASALFDVIFHDTPVRPDHTEQVRNLFLYGVLDSEIHRSTLRRDYDAREYSRALLRAATDALIDPQALVQAVRDPDWRITDFTFLEANPAACEYLQRRREDLIGASMVETVPDIESSGLLAKYIRCAQTGEPVTLEDFPYFSQRYGEIRLYDLRVARAGDDWLSMTWRDVSGRYEGLAGHSEEVRVIVIGDVDVSNAASVTERILAAAESRASVVVDLSGVTFFGCAGCSALRDVNDRLRSRNVDWTIEPGSVVARTLDICGMHDSLPINRRDQLDGSATG